MIFISHTEADKPLVQSIAQQLATEYGKENVFYDSWSVQPGEAIIDKMNDALTRCKFFFFFVSKRSLQSRMVKLEWQTAIFMATKGQVKFIAVKIDDSLLPPILIQKNSINLHKDGLDEAVKKMKDVIEGRNVFRDEHVKQFQNIRAYVSDVYNGIRIEFRAESFSEPQSKFAILFTNGSKEDVDCKVEGISLPTQYVENSSIFKNQKENAFVVSRPTPTSPGFPFIVTLEFKTNNVVLITGIMAAISSTTARSIPVIYKDRTFIPS